MQSQREVEEATPMERTQGGAREGREMAPKRAGDTRSGER